MRRQENDNDKARRYSQALIVAASTVRYAAARSGHFDRAPAVHVRWEAEPSLWLDAATAQRRPAEA